MRIGASRGCSCRNRATRSTRPRLLAQRADRRSASKHSDYRSRVRAGVHLEAGNAVKFEQLRPRSSPTASLLVSRNRSHLQGPCLRPPGFCFRTIWVTRLCRRGVAASSPERSHADVLRCNEGDRRTRPPLVRPRASTAPSRTDTSRLPNPAGRTSSRARWWHVRSGHSAGRRRGFGIDRLRGGLMGGRRRLALGSGMCAFRRRPTSSLARSLPA